MQCPLPFSPTLREEVVAPRQQRAGPRIKEMLDGWFRSACDPQGGFTIAQLPPGQEFAVMLFRSITASGVQKALANAEHHRLVGDFPRFCVEPLWQGEGRFQESQSPLFRETFELLAIALNGRWCAISDRELEEAINRRPPHDGKGSPAFHQRHAIEADDFQIVRPGTGYRPTYW